MSNYYFDSINEDNYEQHVILKHLKNYKKNEDNIRSHMVPNQDNNDFEVVCMNIEIFIGSYEHKSYPMCYDCTKPPFNIEVTTIISKVLIITMSFNDTVSFEEYADNLDFNNCHLTRIKRKNVVNNLIKVVKAFTELKKELIKKFKAKYQDEQIKDIISLVTGKEIDL